MLLFIFENMRKRSTVNNWLTAIALLLFCTIDAKADNKPENSNTSAQSATEYVSGIYNKINFCREARLNPAVFETAYRGYTNLRAAGKLNTGNEIISIADYSLSSNTKRLWIIDLHSKKVLLNTYVAHGQGTGEEFATAFSNRENSHQSSLGFYVTGQTYMGEHGLSLHLHGMDNGYNSAAYQRAVVLHGAAYVSEDFIKSNQRLGRSWGCPAVATELSAQIIKTVKDGTCLFIYHPDKKYLASSYWLHKKGNKLQDEMYQNQFQLSIPQQPDGNESKQLVVHQ